MTYWNGIPDPHKTALVLSAGGMFGAYQAGAWKALSGRFQPDIVIGASAGALNAWAIAGDVDPDELISNWLSPDCARLAAFRLQAPWNGVFDGRPLHEQARSLIERFTPKREIGVVLTDLFRLRQRLFSNTEITWRHLAASTAVPLCYPQVRIGGTLYSDGGLLGALPLWAAARMGATRVVAINVLSQAPSAALGWMVRRFRALAPTPPQRPADLEIVRLSPTRRLGSLGDAVFWRKAAVERAIALGEEDARQFPL